MAQEWMKVEGAAKNDAGEYQVLVGGKWQPATAAAKNDAGEYMAILGASPIVDEPNPAGLSVMDGFDSRPSPTVAAIAKKSGIRFDDAGLSTIASRAQDIAVNRAYAPKGGEEEDMTAKASRFVAGSTSPLATEQAAVTRKPEQVYADAVERVDRGIAIDNESEKQKRIARQEDSSRANEILQDTAKSIPVGIFDLPKAFVGLVDGVTGGAAGRVVDRTNEELGLPEWANPSQWAQSIRDSYSERTKAVNESRAQTAKEYEAKSKAAGGSKFDQIYQSAVGTAEGLMENPSGLGTLLGENLAGQAAIAKATSKILAKEAAALDAKVVANEISRDAANDILSKQAIKYAAISEGALTAGQVGSQISKENPNATYLERMAGLAAGAITGAISFGAGRALGGDAEATMATAMLGQRGAGISGSLPVRMAKGFAIEGLAEELPQSTQEAVLTNLGTRKPWQEGVGGQMVEGLAAGGIMGAGFATLGAKKATEETLRTLSPTGKLPTPLTPAEAEQSAKEKTSVTGVEHTVIDNPAGGKTAVPVTVAQDIELKIAAQPEITQEDASILQGATEQGILDSGMGAPQAQEIVQPAAQTLVDITSSHPNPAIDAELKALNAHLESAKPVQPVSTTLDYDAWVAQKGIQRSEDAEVKWYSEWKKGQENGTTAAPMDTRLADGSTPASSNNGTGSDAANLSGNPTGQFGGSAGDTATPIVSTGQGSVEPVGSNDAVSQTEVGAFGKVFTGFYRNAKAAIAKLMQEKGGEAVGALHHKDVGDIDLVWGNEGTPEQDYKDGMGLAKIAIKHPEVIDNLQEIINSMQVIPEKERKGYLHLESKDHVAKIRLDWDRQSKKWLLTAYEKGLRLDTRADTIEHSSKDDTARLATTPSANVLQSSITGNNPQEQSIDIKPMVEQLIRLKKNATQSGLGSQIESAISKAREVIKSGNGKASDFTKIAKAFKGKDAEIFATLHSIANELGSSATSMAVKSDRAEKQRARMANALKVNPESDTLLTAIYKLGVNPESKDATDIRVALGISGKENPRLEIKGIPPQYLFRKNGKDGYDGLALALYQLGYLSENDATQLSGANGKIGNADSEYSNHFDPSTLYADEHLEQVNEEEDELSDKEWEVYDAVIEELQAINADLVDKIIAKHGHESMREWYARSIKEARSAINEATKQSNNGQTEQTNAGTAREGAESSIAQNSTGANEEILAKSPSDKELNESEQEAEAIKRAHAVIANAETAAIAKAEKTAANKKGADNLAAEESFLTPSEPISKAEERKLIQKRVDDAAVGQGSIDLAPAKPDPVSQLTTQVENLTKSVQNLVDIQSKPAEETKSEKEQLKELNKRRKEINLLPYKTWADAQEGAKAKAADIKNGLEKWDAIGKEDAQEDNANNPAALKERYRTSDFPSAVEGWRMVGGGQKVPGAASEQAAKIEINKHPEWKEKGATIVPFDYFDGSVGGAYNQLGTRYAILIKRDVEVESTPEVSNTEDASPRVLTFEQFAAMNDASRQSIGEAALHRSSNRKSANTHRKQVEAQAAKDMTLIDKRETLREEFARLIESGEVREPTAKEQTIATANGHPDNESTQAARRIADKKGWEWRTKETDKGTALFNLKDKIWQTDKNSDSIGGMGENSGSDNSLAENIPTQSEREEYFRRDYIDRYSAMETLVKEARSKGMRINKNVGNATVTIYHGTSNKNSESILNSGEFTGNTWFASSENGTLEHSKPKHGKENTVISIQVDPRDIETTGANGELYAPNGLVREDGIWKSKERLQKDRQFYNETIAPDNGGADIRFNWQDTAPTIDDRGDEAHHATDEEFETLRKSIQAAAKTPIGITQRPRNATLRDAASLNDIASAFGKKVVGFESSSQVLNQVNGVVLPKSLPNYIFINKDADRPHLAIIGHELVHHLRATNSELYERFVVAIRPYVQDNYAEFNAKMRKRGYSNDDSIREEFLGEIVSDGFMQPAFWESLGKNNPSLIQRIGEMVRELFQKAMRAMGYTNKTEKYLSDFDSVMRIAGDVMGEYGLDANSVLGETSLTDEAKFMVAWHGSPHDHNKFDMSKVGTGEGNQAFGHGLYFAGAREVAEHYRNALSRTVSVDVKGQSATDQNEFKHLLKKRLTNENLDRFAATAFSKFIGYDDNAFRNGISLVAAAEQWADGRLLPNEVADQLEDYAQSLSAKDITLRSGRLYQVELAPSEDEYLLWDKPLSNKFKKAIVSNLNTDYRITKRGIAAKRSDGITIDIDFDNGATTYQGLSSFFEGDDKAASEYLHSLGIRGIKYLDGSSRSAGEGNFNYVIFSDADVSITAKFSKAEESNKTPQTVESVTKATQKLRERWSGFNRIKIVQSVKEIPNELYLRALRAAKPINQDSDGIYDPKTKTVYLIADNISSPERAVWVAIHEVVGHGGIRMLGVPIVESLNHAAKNGFVTKLAKAIATDRGEAFNAIAHADEAIAELAAATITGNADAILERYGVKVPVGMRSNLMGMIKRVVDAVRQFIARVYGKHIDEVSDGEVISLIRRMNDAVEGKEQGHDAGASNVVLASTSGTAARSVGFDNSASIIADYKSDEIIKAHAQYKAAKGGDIVAAVKLVTRLVKPESIKAAKEKFGSDVAYLPVMAQEASGKNQIPNALASHYAAQAGGKLIGGIFQINKAYHTGADAMERMIARSEFGGEVIRGQKYVLVDDVSAMGGTLADMASYIRSKGGVVSGAVLLTNASRSGNMIPDAKVIRSLGERHGNAIKELFGIEPSALTRDESQYLIGFRTTDELRNRAASAIAERSVRILSKTQSKPSDYSELNTETPSFSRAQQPIALNTTAANPTSIPEETEFEKRQRQVQDKMVRFKVLDAWLKHKGVQLTEKANVHEIENLMHAKIANQIQDFRDQTEATLFKRAANAGFTLQQIADYLEAQHIPEANERMREIHQDQSATANGITDDEANLALSEFQAMPKFAEFKSIADEFRAIGEETLTLRLREGLISREQYDAYKATYQYWIPLRGNGKKPGVGKGLSVNAKEKRRLGHGQREDGEMVIENLLVDRERAIYQVEHNRVVKSIIQFALEAKEPDLITVGKPVKRQVLRNDVVYEVQYKGRGMRSFGSENDAKAFINQAIALSSQNKGGGMARSDFAIDKTSDPMVIMQASPMLAENEIQGYVAGHTIRIQLNDEMLARAATNMGVDQLNMMLSACRMVNNGLSKIYTAYSPDFIFRNAIRDFIAGTINLIGDHGAKMAGKIYSNYPRALKELFVARNDPRLSAWVKSYRAAGGNTGAAYLSDIERVGNDAQKAMYEHMKTKEVYRRQYQKVKDKGVFNEAYAQASAIAHAGGSMLMATPVIGHFLSLIEHLNAVTENALRLATYMTLVQNGYTEQKAAAAAKNSTVNFNRKGEISNVAGSLYLFFNPSVQGSARMFGTLLKSEHKGQALAMSGMLAFAAFALAEMARGGGDDDERKWKNIPDYTKDHNLILSFGDLQWTIPVPYEFAPFHSLGLAISDVAHGEGAMKSSWKVIKALVNNTMPLGDPFTGEGKDGANLYQVSPTLVKMALAPHENENSFGAPIQPEKSSWNENKPDSQNMFRNTKGTLYSGAAEWINEVTGGTKYKSGSVDVSPETMRFWVSTLTGGTGRFVADSINAGIGAYQGVAPDVRSTPIVRVFVREASVADARSRFWEASNEARQAADSFAMAKKAHDGSAMQVIREAEGDMIRLSKFADRMGKAAARKRNAIDVIRMDDQMPLSQKREQMKEIEKQEQEYYDKFLKAFDKIKKEKRAA